ncbi:MAG: glycerol acyltransferase [Clostridia bacterium]|nr:glycerol acyltransferase [Clostridia bacterium]
MEHYGKFFKFCRGGLRLFFGKKYKLDGKFPEGACIYITHHRDWKGIIYPMCWMPIDVHVWALDAFCDEKAAFDQMYGYTYTQRLGMPKPIAYVAAKLASKGFAAVLTSSGAIPVYRGSMKIRETLQKTVEYMEKGENIAILPDVDYQSSDDEVGELYTGFLNVDRLYYRRNKSHVRFVPIYADEKKKTLYVGEPCGFLEGENFNDSKDRVILEIRNGINALVKKSEN